MNNTKAERAAVAEGMKDEEEGAEGGVCFFWMFRCGGRGALYYLGCFPR
jgi:hypothetical protein